MNNPETDGDIYNINISLKFKLTFWHCIFCSKEILGVHFSKDEVTETRLNTLNKKTRKNI